MQATQLPPWLEREDRYRMPLAEDFGEWCNGSTADSGSACLGSNPSSPVDFSGKGVANSLLRPGQNAFEPDDNQITDQVSANVLATPAHVFLFETVHTL
jgi:hypothetical protein